MINCIPLVSIGAFCFGVSGSAAATAVNQFRRLIYFPINLLSLKSDKTDVSNLCRFPPHIALTASYLQFALEVSDRE